MFNKNEVKNPIENNKLMVIELIWKNKPYNFGFDSLRGINWAVCTSMPRNMRGIDLISSLDYQNLYHKFRSYSWFAMCALLTDWFLKHQIVHHLLCFPILPIMLTSICENVYTYTQYLHQGLRTRPKTNMRWKPFWLIKKKQ